MKSIDIPGYGRLAGALAALAMLACVATPSSADAAEAGSISRLKGAASIVRGNQVIVAGEGVAVETDDRIETGKGARLEITLIDATKLTLGANAALVIDEFVFDPGKSQGTALVEVVKGALRFTTGKIAAMTDKKVEVKTAFANLAVRGTDFWAGPIDGTNGVLLLTGKVEVATDRGAVVLDKAKEGTLVASRNREPGRVRQWSPERIARALAGVAF